jgi:uncharacterized phage protein (TIGR02220 family)
MSPTQFIQQFSTTKDALIAIDLLITKPEIDYKVLRDEVSNFKEPDISQQILDLFNEVNDTNYRSLDKIKALLKTNPKASFDQFASIIYHKKETWGKDPKMREYLRPTTLFGTNIKFQTYLDDATNYWVTQSKK